MVNLMLGVVAAFLAWILTLRAASEDTSLQRSFQRISIDMPYEHVVKTIGRPPGDFGFSEGSIVFPRMERQNRIVFTDWLGDEWAIRIQFSPTGRVLQKHLVPVVRFDDPPLWEGVTRVLQRQLLPAAQLMRPWLSGGDFQLRLLYKRSQQVGMLFQIHQFVNYLLGQLSSEQGRPWQVTVDLPVLNTFYNNFTVASDDLTQKALAMMARVEAVLRENFADFGTEVKKLNFRLWNFLRR